MADDSSHAKKHNVDCGTDRHRALAPIPSSFDEVDEMRYCNVGEWGQPWTIPAVVDLGIHAKSRYSMYGGIA